ncbi:hypothetical protein Mal33_01650 [Rosistilla oblonga]|uniref:Uncharacterized protein n=1 Tax=Rosistilla oblonga TaxID=2527990 RepID=A0A518IMA7_9BACT|nr:hypothetical protein Mal33_01650 [Rosistilla oblonga]
MWPGACATRLYAIAALQLMRRGGFVRTLDIAIRRCLGLAPPGFTRSPLRG